MRISDWSSDVCSSDLRSVRQPRARRGLPRIDRLARRRRVADQFLPIERRGADQRIGEIDGRVARRPFLRVHRHPDARDRQHDSACGQRSAEPRGAMRSSRNPAIRSEEHTSELQSLMRISYAVFCLKKKKKTIYTNSTNNTKQ